MLFSIQDARHFLLKLPPSISEHAYYRDDRNGPWATLDKYAAEVEAEMRYLLFVANTLLERHPGEITNDVLRATANLHVYPWPETPASSTTVQAHLMPLVRSMTETHVITNNKSLDYDTLETILDNEVALFCDSTSDSFIFSLLPRYRELYVDFVDQLKSYRDHPVLPAPTMLPLMGQRLGGLVAEYAFTHESGHSWLRERDILGRTPFHLTQYYDVVEYVIDGIEMLPGEHEIDAADFLSFTPLDLAAIRNDLPAFKALHQHGASFTRKGWAGMTPLHYAAALGHKDIMNYIIDEAEYFGQLKEIILTKHLGGKTPLELAKEAERLDLYYLMKSEVRRRDQLHREMTG